jgi:DNA sulfur modification protein DndB
MTEGEKLNKRVWKIFEAAGFETQPSSSSSAEYQVHLTASKPMPVDLLAEDKKLKVRIVGSNKSGINVDFATHALEYEQIGKKAKATKVLFVLTKKAVASVDRKLIEERGMALWGPREVEYYEKLTETIGDYAKFEILNALGIHTKEEDEHFKVTAIRIHQPETDSSTELFLFAATPDRLLKTCIVFRRASNRAGSYQRILQSSRLPQIKKFVTQPDALLPTNLVLRLSDDVKVTEITDDGIKDTSGHKVNISSAQYDVVRLEIPLKYASLELIDGQHRLFGFKDTDPATKKSFNLLVAGLRGVDETREFETFLAINDNAKRVNPNLVANLKYTTDDSKCQADSELMAIRVVVDLNDETPFKGLIRLYDTGRKKITLKGFSGYDLKGMLSQGGVLREAFPENEPKQYINALRMYFSTIKSMFKTQWEDPDKYIIATNRGVSAFLKLLKSLMKLNGGPLSSEDVKKYLEPLKDHWPTWETAKLQNKYVGSQGWKQFQRDLVRKIRRKYRKLTV